MYNILVNYFYLFYHYYTNVNIINVLLCHLNSFKINLLILWMTSLSFYYLLNVKTINIIFILFLVKVLYVHNFILFNFYSGYYKIHPILFYLSLISMWIIYQSNSIFKILPSVVLKLLTITFILGSLWALSQFIWGKYWSYDSIEFILIFLIILKFFRIHRILKTQINYTSFFFIQIVFLVILLRLNLIYTKHNFFQQKIITHFLYLIIYLLKYSYYIKKLTVIKKLKKYSLNNIILLVTILLIIFNITNLFIIKNIIVFLFINLMIYLILLLKKLIKFISFHIIYTVMILIFINYNFLFYKLNSFYLINISTHLSYFIQTKDQSLELFIKKKSYKYIKYSLQRVSLKLYNLYTQQVNTKSYLINFF